RRYLSKAGGTTPGAGRTCLPHDPDTRMDQQAKGEFDVERSVEPSCDMGDGVAAGHYRFDKRFAGELEATSVVHMLAVGTDVPGSAAYVAIERVSGILQGRTGHFFLQHNGVMNRGAASLLLTIVPDSGGGALTGISGRMGIDITQGKHFYTLDYQLPVADAPSP
ncbi:MAG TPA: DUF3224 domain-containing protein, partial [Luteimonas sp.]|nr:DUF3224 domain-containing protein [Luteimonas sp.]